MNDSHSSTGYDNSGALHEGTGRQIGLCDTSAEVAYIPVGSFICNRGTDKSFMRRDPYKVMVREQE